MLANMDAEQGLLGLLLNEPLLFDECQLKPYHFQWPAHQKIFDTIAHEIESGRNPDPIFISQKFENDPDFKDVGPKYLLILKTDCPLLNSIKDYEGEIVRQYLRRETMSVIKAVEEEIKNSPLEEPTALLSRVEAIVSGFDKTATQAHSVKKSLQRALEWTNRAISGSEVVYKTGIGGLDHRIGGLKPGGLYVLAGRPGMGKTVAALNIAEFISASRPVLFFSLEMPSEELSMRLIAGRTSVSVFEQMQGRVDTNNMGRILSAKEKLEQLNLIIDESAGIDVDYICSMARRFSRKQKDGVVIIDHLGLIRGNPRLQKVHQIEEITTKLKSLAKNIRAPVLLLSQLSRAVELRDDKKPMLSDLRDSGSIEQDADVVIFAYRPEYYAERKTVERTEKMNDQQYQEKVQKHQDYLESIKGKAFLYIEKNRQGTSGTVELKFDGIRQKFS